MKLVPDLHDWRVRNQSRFMTAVSSTSAVVPAVNLRDKSNANVTADVHWLDDRSNEAAHIVEHELHWIGRRHDET